MTSIKCKKCGLINFSHAHECKRCGFQFENKQSRSSYFQNNQTPSNFGANESLSEDGYEQPKPPCVKCGEKQNVAVHNFEKKYLPPVVILGLFLGLLPYILLKIFLTTTHYLAAPFCHNCWDKFKNARMYSVFNVLFFFVLLVAGTYIAFSYDSEGILAGTILGAILLYALGRFMISSISPKYKKVDSKKVIIDAPFVGEILFEK